MSFLHQLWSVIEKDLENAGDCSSVSLATRSSGSSSGSSLASKPNTRKKILFDSKNQVFISMIVSEA